MRKHNGFWIYTFHQARSLGVPHMYWRHYNGRCRHVLTDDGLVVPVKHWGRMKRGSKGDAGKIWMRTPLGAFRGSEQMTNDPDRDPIFFLKKTGRAPIKGRPRERRFVWIMLTNGFDYVAAFSAIYKGEKTGRDLKELALRFCRRERVMSEIQNLVTESLKAEGVDIALLGRKYASLLDRVDATGKEKLMIEALKLGGGWLAMGGDKKDTSGPGLLNALGGALERLGAGGHQENRPALGPAESGRMVGEPDPVRD